VIVRIAGEGQYEVSDDVAAQLNDLDNQVVAAVDAGDEPGFQEAFSQLIELVESSGSKLPSEELAVSDVIVPPRDISFEEAKSDFTGEGLIPD
jgi:hypothetical protein